MGGACSGGGGCMAQGCSQPAMHAGRAHRDACERRLEGKAAAQVLLSQMQAHEAQHINDVLLQVPPLEDLGGREEPRHCLQQGWG